MIIRYVDPWGFGFRIKVQGLIGPKKILFRVQQVMTELLGRPCGHFLFLIGCNRRSYLGFCSGALKGNLGYVIG